jgi:hypothetical protein
MAEEMRNLHIENITTIKRVVAGVSRMSTSSLSL